jgi:putative spermidine/putrescine transport system permease protein/spermidine/putrescine transport system permease protein
MVSSRIANDIEIFFNWGAASALGVVLLVMTALLIWIFMKLLKISNPVDRAIAA